MRFTTTASSVSCGDVCYEADKAGVLDIAAEHLGLFAHQIAAGVLVVAPGAPDPEPDPVEPEVIEDTTEADGEPAAAPSAKPAKKKAK